MPQQYGAYPGMLGSTPYFQPAGSAYANMQSLQFYHQPPFRDLKMPHPPTEMPTEGPNPSSNIVSSHYSPADPSQSAQGIAPQLPSAQPSSSTPTLASTPTRRSSTRSSTPPKPAPSELTPRPASRPPIAEPAELAAIDPAPAHISIQPSTPLAIPNRDPDGNSSKSEHDADSTLEESPTVGRMTNVGRKALQEGFEELDACIHRISAKTGLNSAQIVDRWDATKTRVANSWNIYQSFFEERREQELARLDPEVHTHRE